MTEPSGEPALDATSLSEAAEQEAPTPMEGLRAIQRRERHAAVHALYDKGVQIQVIAEALGLDRKTVRRYAHAATPDEVPLSGSGARRVGRRDGYGRAGFDLLRLQILLAD